MEALIIDGYIDEPTNLGVPPYLATYPRYIAGVLSILGYSIKYLTIDQLRLMNFSLDHVDVLILIAGFTVPGKYLGGVPIKLKEIDFIASLPAKIKILCGPLTYGYSNKGGAYATSVNIQAYDYVFYNDYEKRLYELLSDSTIREPHYDFINKIAKEGAFIYRQHPNFPYVITEIETSKGCDRKSFCSYCTEFLKGRITYRNSKGIIEEIEALYNNGCRYFRIGKQSNILSYMGPIPNFKAIKLLYEGIYLVAPELKVLHTDNANSLSIHQYPKESLKVLQTISQYVTPGDVLPFGIETFDPKVINANNLKTLPKDSLKALKIVSDVGRFRIDGIPKILPGLNLLFGLPGESKKTYKINFEYLKRASDSDILLRRINIRKVVVFKQTPLYSMKRKFFPKDFEHFKRKVREEIDRPMLKRVFPVGTILKEVIMEKVDGNITFGRQIGSYPILVGVYGIHKLKQPIDVVVVDHGYRSVSAFKYPIEINRLSIKDLQHLPGIGKKRAEKIYQNRNLPFSRLLSIISDDKVVNFLKKYSVSI